MMRSIYERMGIIPKTPREAMRRGTGNAFNIMFAVFHETGCSWDAAQEATEGVFPEFFADFWMTEAAA
jgi:hypothetical protein